MNRTRRTARTAIGLCCLAISVLALGWLIGRYIPGEPREPLAAAHDSGGGAKYYGSLLEADEIVDVGTGTSYAVDALTFGKKYRTSDNELARTTDTERQNAAAQESWDFDYPNLEFAVVGAKAVSMDAFKEWYPHFAAVEQRAVGSTRPTARPETRVILVEATVTNTGAEAAALPDPLLWSGDIAGADDRLRNGMPCDRDLIVELYGEPSDEFVSYTVLDSWNVIEAGETQTRTYPYVVCRGDLASSASLDDLDLANYCLAFSDYDPATIYRFWLA